MVVARPPLQAAKVSVLCHHPICEFKDYEKLNTNGVHGTLTKKKKRRKNKKEREREIQKPFLVWFNNLNLTQKIKFT